MTFQFDVLWRSPSPLRNSSVDVDLLVLAFNITCRIPVVVRSSQNPEFKKQSNWNMCEAPSEMHMHNMVNIDSF